MRKTISLLILSVLLLSPPARAIGEERNMEANGFLLGNFAGRTTGQRPEGGEGGDFLLAEERLRLDLSAWSDSIDASARLKGDFFHDAVADEFDVELREAYLDYTTGDFDLRLGRQVATWGVGDTLFINDVFPKDWVSFFSGRPLEYLKTGVDGLRTRHEGKALNTELLIIPTFEPDNVPTSERFFLFDPFASVATRDKEEPDTTYENTELALRVYGRLSAFDVSVYAYRGFWRTPSMRPDSFASPTKVTAFYPALSTFGVSAEGSALGGVLSLEAGYYHSRDDPDGDDPVVPNSEARFLVGYQRQPWEDFIVGVQYYGEVMGDYPAYRKTLPAGFPAEKEYRDTVTLRLEQMLRHQTLKLSLFCFYSPVDDDYLVQPKVSYNFSDKLSAALGANVFGGEKDATFLGQFDKNDNLYLSFRFDLLPI